MAFERHQLVAAFQIPNDGCFILAARDDSLAIGRERATQHGPIMAREWSADLLARGAVPKPGRFIAADRQHLRSIR